MALILSLCIHCVSIESKFLKCLWVYFLDKGHERPPGVLVHRCEEHGDVGGAPSPRYPDIEDFALAEGMSCTVAETGSALTTDSVLNSINRGARGGGKELLF